MKRAVVYSKRHRPPPSPAGTGTAGLGATGPGDGSAASPAAFDAFRWKGLALFLLGVLLTLLGLQLAGRLAAPSPPLTQRDIDAAVLHTLTTQDLPSIPARAAAAVQGAVVLVQGFGSDSSPSRQEDRQAGVGTGVVIKDDGTILTNFHVVSGARRLLVTFADGTESPALVMGVHPDKDLAVLKPQKIPDDLQPAVLGSSRQLSPGDGVVAVGFPFGVGPSVSSGVVSGLDREFVTPQGARKLTGLIQFDAAANPGNSGGPLVNLAGEVVGIVTAILNPTSARTFIGIGFATTIEEAGMAVGLPPF
ncbi:MAG: S1C family serine protease [Limnohabitans sp.]